MLPIAAEFSYQISKPPFSKAVRDDGGLALVDILQRVMQQSDVLEVTDAFRCYRSPVREDTNILFGTTLFHRKKARNFVGKPQKSSALIGSVILLGLSSGILRVVKGY